ncbi:hypothetical protein [Roseimicrobium sp. ORNL1]|uniref:hypothetical protein n=1 Tax=Roseimicrobium sp. ORNL1 TaxID=2711231 RepID=UPI0013E1EF2F|nr:hypothetical protein [Roseimicrobium sp. ORNL1]QIF04372.1 hypothetical protein G5S37_23550 [Roseimicrobium sp. ORNL1]
MRLSFLHNFRQALLAGAFLAASTAAQAASKIEDLVKLLPESAVVIIGLKDTQELVKDWDSSDAGRFMEDEAVKRWMAPLYKDGESSWDKFFNKKTGTTFREALTIYPGASAAGFVVENVEDFDSEETRHVSVSDIKGKETEFAAAKAKQLDAYKGDEYPDAVLKTKEIDGVEVSYISEDKEEDAWWIEAWAVVDGLVIEASDEDLVTEMISRVKAAQGQNPAAAHFARLAELRGATADITVYGHLDSVFDMAKTHFDELAKEKPSPLMPQHVYDALGLKELHATAACIDLNDKQARGELVLFHDEKPQGLFPALIRGTSTEVPQPAFFPADVDSGTVTRTSPGEIYDSILKAVNKLGPMALMATGQIGALEKEAGISIRNDLLGSMDDLYLEISKTTPTAAGALPTPNQVTAFKLKNPARFQSSFDALWKLVGNGFGAFEESDYEGHKIFVMKPAFSGQQGSGEQGFKFAYTVTDEYVFLAQGAPDLLHKVLGRLKNSPAGTSLWDQPQSQAALAALPGGFTALGVSNSSAILRTVLTTMAGAQAMVPHGNAAAKSEKKGPKGPKSKPDATDAKEEGGEDSEDADEGFFDPAASPPDEVFDRYFGVGASAVYSHPDATQIIYISQPAEKK